MFSVIQNIKTNARAEAFPETTTSEEFIAVRKRAHSFSVPQPLPICDLCNKSGSNHFLCVYSPNCELFCHENCWEDSRHTTLDLFFRKQFEGKVSRDIEIRRVCLTDQSDSKVVLDDYFDSDTLMGEPPIYDYVKLLLEAPKKLERHAVASVPTTVTKPKTEDKRGKEIRLLEQTLLAKEPVRLAPVIATHEQKIMQEKTLVSCDLCSTNIASIHVRIKLRNGTQLLCHETCWKICPYNVEEKQKEIQRLYRYDANGKCLEKIAFAVQQCVEQQVNVKKLPKEDVLIAPREKSVVTKNQPTEYRPSWREVDVHDYEVLKKVSSSDNKEKQERRRAKAAVNAAKFIDLALPTHKHESSRDNTAITIVGVIPDKDESFTAACCAVLTETSSASTTVEDDLLPFCVNCGQFPCGYQRPCYS